MYKAIVVGVLFWLLYVSFPKSRKIFDSLFFT